MKLQELYTIIGSYLEQQPVKYSDFTVMVPLASPSIGYCACTEVTGARPGFDWDNGRFFLQTQGRLVEKTREEDVLDASRDLMMYLATKPVKKETYEVRMAKSILKRCGYTDEQFEKYRHLFHEEKK